jgi:hypothetical protein
MRRVFVLAVLAALTGCGAERAGPVARHGTPRAISWRFAGGGLAARIPAGWHVTGRPLTGVASPLQRLVVSSFVVRQRSPDGGCRPSTALREMPADGALLFMFEYRGPTRRDVRGWPRRPRRFVLDPRTLGTYECLGRSYMVRFADHRRVFQAHIYLGRHAGGATRRRILGVLDSLRVGALSPRAAAVWIAPSRLLSKTPYLGVAALA